MTDNVVGSFTRRTFLGASLLAGAVVVVGCAPGAPMGLSASAPAGPQERGGTLRVALTDGSNADMDPHTTTSANGVKKALYDGLIEYDENAQLTNALAEVFEPEDGDLTRWIVRVKEGVTWHDGKPLTADDVEFTIRRIMNPEAPMTVANLMAGIDLDRIEKLDDRTLRLNLTAPNSQLKMAFTRSYTSIVPVGFDPANPIGTGPFKHGSFEPQQRWEGTRFDDYWRIDGGAFLDGIQLISFASSTSAINALLADQIDAIPGLPPASLRQIASRKDVRTVESEAGWITQVTMNCRPGMPFEDPRVREAVRLAVDRKQLIDVIYSGHGAVGNDLGVFPQWDHAVDPELPKPKRDLKKARKLLKEAGKEKLTVTCRVTQQIPGQVESAELLQQQLKEVGIDMRIDRVGDPAQFFTDAYFEAEMQVDYTNTMSMYDGCYYYWLSDSGYNSTGFADERVDRLFAEAVALPQTEYEKKMHEVSRIIQKDGPWMVWGRQNIIDVHTDKVVGIVPTPAAGFLNNMSFQSVSLVK